MVAPAAPAPRGGRQTTILVALLYLGASCVSLWPLLLDPAELRPDTAPGNQLYVPDFNLIVWSLAWVSHALGTDPFSLFDANSFHPSPRSLAFSEHFVGYLPLFAPVYALSGNPILATNVLLILVPALRAIATYLLAARFMAAPAALVAGALFGFLGLSVRQAPLHFHVAGALYLPLAMFFTERWLDRAQTKDAIAVAVFLFLQAAVSFYLGYATFLAFGAYLPWALWTNRERIDVRRLVGLGLAGSAAVLAMVPLALPYLQNRAEGAIPAYETGLGLSPYNASVLVQKHLAPRGWKWIAYPLAALAFLPGGRKRTSLRWLGLTLVLVGIAMAHGPWILTPLGALWSPYQILPGIVPGFETVRVPVRFLLISYLGLALLCGLGFDRASSWMRSRSRWWLGVVLVGMAIAGLAVPPLPVTKAAVGDAVPKAHHWLAEHGDGRPLFEWPRGSFITESRRMLFSTNHWLPIVGGYSGYPFGSAKFLYSKAGRLRSTSSLQNLVDHVDIGWLLVHVEELPPAEKSFWDQPGLPGLTQVGEWQGDRLFRVDLPPRNPRRDLFSPTETLEGNPKHALGARCPGRIVVVQPDRNGHPAGGPRAVTVRVTNESDAIWPATSLLRKNVVELWSCWDVRCERRTRTPLPSDVRPGETVQVRVPIKGPRLGNRRVRIWLEQAPDRPLASCGVAPVDVVLSLGKT